MSRGGITWTVPPATLKRNVALYGTRVIAATVAVAEYCAQTIEDYAKQNASWIDRSGNARKLLKAEVDSFAEDMVVLYLVQGVDYGKWLELSKGGKYRIVMPALEAHYHEIMAMLRGVLR